MTISEDNTHGADPPSADGPDSAAEIRRLRAELETVHAANRRLHQKNSREKQLEPYQVELLKLQRHLEANGRKMVVLFEGRDAAGKGGTIRRVTRYMNEKHYRVVALGKPTEEHRVDGRRAHSQGSLHRLIPFVAVPAASLST